MAIFLLGHIHLSETETYLPVSLTKVSSLLKIVVGMNPVRLSSFATISVVTILFTFAVAGINGNEHIPGKYKLTSDLKSEELNALMKAMEMKDGQREMIRNWKYLELKVTNDGPKFKFSVNMGGGPYMERTYEDGKDYDDKMSDGRPFKAHVNIKDNVFTRQDTHTSPNMILTITSKFDKEIIDVEFSLDKAGQILKAKQQLKRMSEDPFGGFMKQP